MSTLPPLEVKIWPTPQNYATIFLAMRDFTEHRTSQSADSVWLLEHQPVFTQGQAGKPEHILHYLPHVPIVQTDRGGQVTWHGPGQLTGYLMLDLRRLGWNVRDLVTITETLLIQTLADFGLQASARRDAPGVYVNNLKIASLGFKIRKGCSYHGFALNIDNDLSDFSAINPCGFTDLSMTRLSNFMSPAPTINDVTDSLLKHFLEHYHVK